MFTGIVETSGRITHIKKEKDNLILTVNSPLAPELTIDQSLSHNGLCLTVVAVASETHTVTAVKETLTKTNLGSLTPGDTVNLERAMKLGDRLDGHLVQGHVDTTGHCTAIEEAGGSWLFTFTYLPSADTPLIKKGSITIDGTSLTIVDAGDNRFSVAVIPYTYQHTNFKTYKEGSVVNLEFDMIGKYIARLINKS